MGDELAGEKDRRCRAAHRQGPGRAARAGWHLLERRKDGALRMAYWHQHRLNWWVAVEEGRTQPMSDLRVKEVYTYRAFVEPPASKKT
jgi:hypothetical protein